MALGRRVGQEVDASGSTVARMVPRDEQVAENADRLDDLAPTSRRAHYRLWEGFTADNPNRIVADRALNFEPGFAFEKYELVVRDPVTVFVSFGRPSSGIDHYDDLLILGMQSRSDRCEPATMISLWFDNLPGSAADLYLYAGRAADPT